MTKGGFKMEINITTPISREKAKSLKAGDMVKITGVIYTARDAAHKRMLENLHKGIALPVDLKDQTIYFAGPAPAKPNEPIGSVGPTTSYRMDAYSPETIELGLTCMIGKGARSKEVVDAMKKYGAVYIGEWENDMMNGHGIYYYSSSSYPRLEGEFVNNQPEGECEYYTGENASIMTMWKDGECVSQD